MSDDESFGRMLRRLRVERAFSQNVLAHMAKIDPAYVNRIERGGQRTVSGDVIPVLNPSRHVVLALAEALDLGAGRTDRFLVAAGLAPVEDWQSRAIDAEARLEQIRQALWGCEEEPPFIRRRTG